MWSSTPSRQRRSSCYCCPVVICGSTGRIRVARLVDAERPIAAICAGTLALGRAGILDDRQHTSNGRDYLSTQVPEYAGASHYIEAAALRDAHVITATGLAPVDFAREIFAELQIFTAADEALWYRMFKHGRLPEAAT